jgi:hypothetical protein
MRKAPFRSEQFVDGLTQSHAEFPMACRAKHRDARVSEHR